MFFVLFCFFAFDNNFIKFRVGQCLVFHRIVYFFIVAPGRNMSIISASRQNKAIQFFYLEPITSNVALATMEQNSCCITWAIIPKNEIYTEGRAITESTAGTHTT